MRSGTAFLVTLACGLVTACGGEDGRPPPIHVTAGSSPGVIGGDVGGAVDDGGATFGAATDGATAGTFGGATFDDGTFDDGTFGGATTLGANVSVLSGSILTDDSLFPLPMNCTVNLHEVGAVDPGTGLSSGALIGVPVSVGETQQRFDIGQDEVESIVNQGDLVYVEVRCDVDGNGSFDEFGGWYPLLPAEIVELPAEDIDVVVGELPV
jgi:hypothetical protein